MEEAAAQPDLSSVSTLTTLTQGLLRDYDSLVARSGTGLRSCKEVHAFLKERASIEATYGNALVRQGRSAVGLQERGTCRMGLIAFKSKTDVLMALPTIEDASSVLCLEFDGTASSSGWRDQVCSRPTRLCRGGGGTCGPRSARAAAFPFSPCACAARAWSAVE